MRQERTIGNNCRLLLNKRAVTEETFARTLGYSTLDVKRLMDGRLLTTDEDIQEIAKFFDVKAEYILTDHGKDVYSGPGFMHCMDEFTDGANEDKVLDIFDMYCDLKEMLSK